MEKLARAIPASTFQEVVAKSGIWIRAISRHTFGRLPAQKLCLLFWGQSVSGLTCISCLALVYTPFRFSLALSFWLGIIFIFALAFALAFVFAFA